MAEVPQRRSEGERGEVEELLEVLGVGYVQPRLRPEHYDSDRIDGGGYG